MLFTFFKVSSTSVINYRNFRIKKKIWNFSTRISTRFSTDYSWKGNLNRVDTRRFVYANDSVKTVKGRRDRSSFASKGSRAFFDKDGRRLLGGAVSGACISNDVVATETLPRLGFRDDRQSFRHGTTAATRLTVAQVKPIGKIRSLVVTLRDTAAESAHPRKNQRFRFLRTEFLEFPRSTLRSLREKSWKISSRTCYTSSRIMKNTDSRTDNWNFRPMKLFVRMSKTSRRYNLLIYVYLFNWLISKLPYSIKGTIICCR